MVSLVGGALLELAAAHLLPALVAEAGSLALRAAARGVTRAGAPGETERAAPPEPPVVAVPVRAPERECRAGPRLVPSVSVLSHVPGRVRFRVVGLRGDAGRADAVAARLRRFAGVLDASVSTVTGTALVHYDPARTELSALQAAAAPPLGPPPRRPSRGRPRLRLVRS